MGVLGVGDAQVTPCSREDPERALGWPPRRVGVLAPARQLRDGSASPAAAFPPSLRRSQGGANVFLFAFNWEKTQKGTWRVLSFSTRHAVLSHPLR